MNKIFLSGNLTRDPEVRYTQSGKAVARMGIAVKRGWRSKNADTDQPDADFFNLVAWEKTAEFCGRYLTKGSRVIVEGRLQNYSYNAEDGTKRNGVDVIVENIEFGDSKRNTGDGGGNHYSDGSTGSTRNNSRTTYDDGFGGSDVPSPEDVPF